ncbi:MAG: hypothetical protein WD572_03020 [Gammaproteobacteria bacterium]
MATVNFSVPEEVKKAFDETFKGKNKSAIVASLMAQAVDEAERQERRKIAMQQILQRRKQAPATSAKVIAKTRREQRR